MLEVKDGVRFKVLMPQVINLFNALNGASASLKKNITITSGNDGEHKKNSYHYRDLALDVRRWGLEPNELDRLMDILRGVAWKNIRGYYDVVLESNHIHVEFDLDRFNKHLSEGTIRLGVK